MENNKLPCNNVDTSSKPGTFVDEHRMPDFLIIGAQKAGTSAASRNLNRHPDIYLPQKEMHFFDNPLNLRRGVQWYSTRVMAENVKQKPVVGEKTPHYVFSIPGMKAIYTMLPNVKLLMLVREPIRRAYSSFRMRTEFKLEKRNFVQAITEELDALAQKRVRGEMVGVMMPVSRTKRTNSTKDATSFYVERGFYGAQIDHVLQRFDRCNLHVAIMERMLRHPNVEYRRIFEFLGVNTSWSESARMFNQRGPAVVVPDNVNVTTDDISDWEWDSPDVKRIRTRLQVEVFEKENERLFEYLGERVHEWDDDR